MVKQKGEFEEWWIPEMDLTFKLIGEYKDYKKLIGTYWEDTFEKEEEKPSKLDLN